MKKHAALAQNLLTFWGIFHMVSLSESNSPSAGCGSTTSLLNCREGGQGVLFGRVTKAVSEVLPSMDQFILALDQGTTSSRAILFDQSGRPVASGSRGIAPDPAGPGVVEHDPEVIWQTQLGVAREVLARAEISADRIAAIGVTNQRETTILWERETGKPVAPAIVWQSRISAPICERWKAEGLGAAVPGKDGLGPRSLFFC